MTKLVYEPMQSAGRSLIHAFVDLAVADDGAINCDAEALKRLRRDCSSTITRLHYAMEGLGRLLAYESDDCERPLRKDHFDLALSVAEIAGIVAELEMGKSALESAKPVAGNLPDALN